MVYIQPTISALNMQTQHHKQRVAAKRRVVSDVLGGEYTAVDGFEDLAPLSEDLLEEWKHAKHRYEKYWQVHGIVLEEDRNNPEYVCLMDEETHIPIQRIHIQHALAWLDSSESFAGMVLDTKC